MKSCSLNGIYGILFKRYGKQYWWPGDDEFEIAIGAILTQSVSWRNVEPAIKNLKDKDLLFPDALDLKGKDEIAQLIKPTGYFNQKAKKIKNFLEWFKKYNFSFNLLKKKELKILREELLLINGVGPETADSILLYALSKKIFVIDAYTRRIFTRLGALSGDEDYSQVQDFFHKKFSGDLKDYNEYHALIVIHGKDVCKKKPLCDKCCIADYCKAYVECAAM